MSAFFVGADHVDAILSFAKKFITWVIYTAISDIPGYAEAPWVYER